MVFEKKIPLWRNAGAEPPEELKKEGFKAGYRPPAAYFNWFFNGVSECLKELAEKLKLMDEKVETTGQVRIGGAETPLNARDTLFVIDSGQAAFKAARVTNVTFDNPGETENLGTTKAVAFVEGKLTVSEEPKTDTTFHAKLF